jgi:hypothetical protein
VSIGSYGRSGPWEEVRMSGGGVGRRRIDHTAPLREDVLADG